MLVVEVQLTQREVVNPLLSKADSVARLLNRLIQSLQPNPNPLTP
jgi:hypothetical protein